MRAVRVLPAACGWILREITATGGRDPARYGPPDAGTPERTAVHNIFCRLLIALSCAGAGLAQAQPTLVVNGVPTPAQTDNTAIPHLQRSGPLSLVLKGTPNAPFALLLAGDAFDGSPGGETNITSGFFLKPWVIPGVLDVPIHPVFDGIGMEFIRQKLNSSGQASLAVDDIVNDVPSPFFRFNAAGEFVVEGIVPLIANFVNLAPSVSAPNPLPIALESQGATTVALYLQVVELNVSTLAVTTGTGCKVIFDQLVYPASIAYAEGTSTFAPTNASAAIVTQNVFPAVVADSNLADGATVTPAVASDFSFATQGIDFWVIGLSGTTGVVSASNPANGLNGTGTPIDQDVSFSLSGLSNGLVGMWNQASGIELFTGTQPVRNNDNKEFSRIDLPGNRALFHYRDVATLRYGFGILFRDTNTWRNLTPFATHTFANTSQLSAWEYEVTVTPDGKRAVVVLDQPSPATTDRVFMLNLEPGGVFANGTTIHEFVPGAPDVNNFRKVFEESMQVVSDGAGSWVAFFDSSDVTVQSVSTIPNRLYRVNLADSGGVPVLVLPGGSFPSINRVDRQHAVTPDRLSLLVIAGNSTAAENVHTITNVTTAGHSILNATGNLITALAIGEFNEANDGQLGIFAVSEDSQFFAFAREDAGIRWPRVARVDGSTAGQTVDIIQDIADGGVIDKVDFAQGRDYSFSQDNNYMIHQMGFFVAGALTDRFELFATDINSKVTRNLTRTCRDGPAATPATLFGPWNPQGDLTTNRATLDPCGYFKSRGGEYLFFLRELRGIASQGFDRQNLVAVSVASQPGGVPASLEMINVTGTEFEAFDGEAPPSFGAPDVVGSGGFGVDSFPEYHRFRRIGGSGPFQDYVYFVGILAGLPGGDPKTNIDQLFAFDLENPGPAIQLTQFFNGTGSPYAVRTAARIIDIKPSDDGKVLYVVDNGDLGGALDNQQDLFLADFASFGAPQRIPSTATAFSRVIVSGSSFFYPGAVDGVMFSAGFTVRPAGATLDGFTLSGVDPSNALDSTAFFYRTVTPTAVTAIVPLTTNSRSATMFSVLPN
jgi:hypothetical protein